MLDCKNRKSLVEPYLTFDLLFYHPFLSRLDTVKNMFLHRFFWFAFFFGPF